ncbi:sugar phosphate isomerase [Mangrovactinospora gilvigrisea]|uniref:Sugar phosphate isomerase n=1 Tax=Mangrovactinospora gilvigrisea TaxID=1428644 RepID=A0A1J7CBR2_9ACTN|nr:TIM barrel protein [Mangrovactinospora gilvigrisea]OIV38952.1 sugar phosphate isomerase [Mangrovactinospora gilvigrisea]
MSTLSLQLYSIRDHLSADRAATLKRVAEIGYRTVEPFGLGSFDKPAEVRAEEARGLKADLDAAGLSVSSVHAGVAAGDLSGLVEECRILGTDTVFIPVPGLLQGFEGDVFGDAEKLSAFAARVNAAAAELADSGIRLGYHNHAFEWPGYESFWTQADDRVLAELDVYWATVAGQDPAALLAALGERCVAVHLKDGPAKQGEPQTPIGTGDVDVPAAIAAAPWLDWHIAEIDTTEQDELELLAANRAKLLELGTKA